MSTMLFATIGIFLGFGLLLFTTLPSFFTGQHVTMMAMILLLLVGLMMKFSIGK